MTFSLFHGVHCLGMMVWRGRGHELVDAIGAYDLYTDRRAGKK